MTQFTQILQKETPVLWELYLEADPEEQAVRRYLPGCLVYAAAENGTLTAAACVLPLNDKKCELKNLAVTPRKRRQGQGSALCQYIFQHCQQAGFTHMTVGTADVSAGALRFYKRLGFKETGRIKQFFISRYTAPVYDNGKQCKDMILLERPL